MTAQQIKAFSERKIITIQSKVGMYASMMEFKVMKSDGLIVVINREGLLKFWGNAQLAYYSGKKKYYRTFKTPKGASNYINKKR